MTITEKDKNGFGNCRNQGTGNDKINLLIKRTLKYRKNQVEFKINRKLVGALTIYGTFPK